MYRRILVAVDGSQAASAAIEHSIRLAKATASSLLFVHVSLWLSPLEISSAIDDGYVTLLEDHNEGCEIFALNAFEYAASVVKRAGLPFQSVRIMSDDVLEALLDCASAHQCDLIVIGAIGRGMYASYGRHLRKVAFQAPAGGIPLLVVQ